MIRKTPTKCDPESCGIYGPCPVCQRLLDRQAAAEARRRDADKVQADAAAMMQTYGSALTLLIRQIVRKEVARAK